ncbi:glutamyl-tRNA reductase [Pseudanabaena sp. lw0831]|uniref:glutamyl-tRNA reductase n=1 Tax=Pseudanabaena sp. lw0831 TaxID=1357935 RepID=UPI0019167B7F|nr:glutamyl-tRNA reductase [Pseudanabaena sp. lw0831]GBO54514.1 glutamyl-tRNA reductase [Pseudanabaena sp. lw0831]
MNIAVVGLSHKTATVEVREKLSIPEDRMEAAIAQLMSYPSIEEAAILSTCNRLELYVVTNEAESGIREIMQFLSEFSQLPLQYLRRYLFILLRQDAVTHLMRVASGLDSLVLGEGQILAQVKNTHRLAQQNNGTGRILNQLFKQSLSAGKRVRTETEIGTGAVSISSAAVELAQIKLENLSDKHTTIVGAGKMSRLLVKHLISKGAKKIAIVNRSRDRAAAMLKEFEASDAEFDIRPLDQMLDCVAISDLVFTSTASTEVILNRQNLEAIARNHTGLTLVDISVPRNISSDVKELPNTRAYNVDDLQAVVAGNQESRRLMAMQAEILLEGCVSEFDMWWRSLETVPTISKLRQKLEIIREQEMEKALSRLGNDFADKHQDVIESMTRGIINKILHDPMVQLRAQQDIETRRRAMQMLQVLFDLDSPSSQFKEG